VPESLLPSWCAPFAGVVAREGVVKVTTAVFTYAGVVALDDVSAWEVLSVTASKSETMCSKCKPFSGVGAAAMTPNVSS
jgi:hypothetical protein